VSQRCIQQQQPICEQASKQHRVYLISARVVQQPSQASAARAPSPCCLCCCLQDTRIRTLNPVISSAVCMQHIAVGKPLTDVRKQLQKQAARATAAAAKTGSDASMLHTVGACAGVVLASALLANWDSMLLVAQETATQQAAGDSGQGQCVIVHLMSYSLADSIRRWPSHVALLRHEYHPCS
jgi:hypothetical protein